MLNQHEVAAHNRKVALKQADKLIDRVDPVMVAQEDARRAEKLAKRAPLPMCKPEARAPRKIYKGGISTGTRSHNVGSVMRDMAATRNTQVHGITSFARAERPVQRVIDMNKVKTYLAK